MTTIEAMRRAYLPAKEDYVSVLATDLVGLFDAVDRLVDAAEARNEVDRLSEQARSEAVAVTDIDPNECKTASWRSGRPGLSPATSARDGSWPRSR